MRVFISYRRDDGALSARLIHEKLANRFGASAVFLDTTDITPGDSFPERISRELADAEVVVAVLGPRWAELLGSRAPQNDYVRIELSEAHGAGKRIIPVLVDGAAASSFAAAPSDFTWLTKLDAIELTPRALDADLQKLVDAVRGQRSEDILDELRRRQRTRTLGVAIAFVAFLAAWTSALDFFALEARVDAFALAVFGALDPRPLDPRVVQIAIDDATEAAIGRRYDLTWRREYARLIDRLTEARVRTIAFDVRFERETPDDAALASSIRRARAAGVDVVLAASGLEAGRPRIARVIAGAASGWGLSCAGTKLGSVGAMLISATHGAAEPKEHWPSLALSAAFPGRPVVSVDARRHEIRLGGGQAERAVRFSREESVERGGGGCGMGPGDSLALGVLAVPRIGALRDTEHLVSFERVLTLDPRTLHLVGKTVLVGGHLAGDVHRTALRGERYGVELHLAQLGMLLEDATPRSLGVVGQLANMCAIALAAVGLESRRSRWGRARVAATLAAAFVVYLACAAFLYLSERLLLNLAAGLGAFAAAWWGATRVRRIGESA